jgi:hypothetical protein
MEAIPRVNEVNAMCEEMALKQRFAVVLLANQDKVAATIRKGKEEHFETLVDTEVWIRMFFEDKSFPSALWHIEKFWNRVYLMRELYQVWLWMDPNSHCSVLSGFTIPHCLTVSLCLSVPLLLVVGNDALQRFAECNCDMYALYGESGYDVNTDPFTDPVSAQLIGRASLYLDALTYLLDVDEVTPIVDYKVWWPTRLHYSGPFFKLSHTLIDVIDQHN